MADHPISSIEVRSLLDVAIHRLLENDTYLFEHDLHERTITHKLAEYLQPLFPAWNVDCEYNRDGHEPKRVRLGDPPEPEWDQGSNVFPDIIVHQRGNNDHNLLIVEAKKARHARPAIDPYDRMKISAFSRDLSYRFGAAILFAVGTEPGARVHLSFYSNGEWT